MRHLLISVTAMLISSASVTGMYNMQEGRHTNGSWLQMEAGQFTFMFLSSLTKRLINIQATHRYPPMSSHLLSHSKSCQVELAPTTLTPLKAVNTPFCIVPGTKSVWEHLGSHYSCSLIHVPHSLFNVCVNGLAKVKSRITNVHPSSIWNKY